MKFIKTSNGLYIRDDQLYIRGHQSQKKLAILEMERRQWCKEVIYHD